MVDTTAGDTTETAIDDTLRKTDIGQFIEVNKVPLIVIVVLLFAAALGYGVYREVSASGLRKDQDKVHRYHKATLGALADKKATPEDATKKFKELLTQVSHPDAALAVGLGLASVLSDMGSSALAIEAMEKMNSELRHDFGKGLVGHQLAALYEDNGRIDDAISILKKNLTLNVKYLEAKTYFDLGRLYKQKNDLGNANTNFNHVLNNFRGSEFEKLARIYLESK